MKTRINSAATRRRGHCFGPLPPGIDTGLSLLIFCCVAAFGVVAHVLVTYVLTPREPPATASSTKSISIILATEPVRLAPADLIRH